MRAYFSLLGQPVDEGLLRDLEQVPFPYLLATVLQYTSAFTAHIHPPSHNSLSIWCSFQQDGGVPGDENAG